MWKSEQTRRIGRWSVTTWWTKARRSSDTGRTSQGMLHPLSGGPVWRKTVTHVLAPFVTHVLALHRGCRLGQDAESRAAVGRPVRAPRGAQGVLGGRRARRFGARRRRDLGRLADGRRRRGRGARGGFGDARGASGRHAVPQGRGRAAAGGDRLAPALAGDGADAPAPRAGGP